jgi:hypothetical protein
MAQIVADVVKETTTTTGTGNVTLAGAVSTFQAFSAVCANGDTFFYRIAHQSANEWEVGFGSFVSATPAVARTTILESSNADAAVSFSAGTKDVMLVSPAITQKWGVLAPAQITSDQNDYNPTGLKYANNLRISADRPYRSITGMQGGLDGRQVALENNGSYPILIRAENTGSSAANRFNLKTDLALWPGSEMNFSYDGTSSRWETEVAICAYDRMGWQQRIVYEDDFLGGGTELGEQGSLGWFNTAAGTAVYTTVANGAAGHVGVIVLQTGTTSTNAHGMQLGQAATNGIARAQDIEYLGFLVAVPTTPQAPRWGRTGTGSNSIRRLVPIGSATLARRARPARSLARPWP